MQTDHNQTHNQNIQQAQQQLDDLLHEAKKVNQEIRETSDKTRSALDDIESKTDSAIQEVEKIYADLDAIEKEAGDELDHLVLQQAEEVARE